MEKIVDFQHENDDKIQNFKIAIIGDGFGNYNSLKFNLKYTNNIF